LRWKLWLGDSVTWLGFYPILREHKIVPTLPY
jgi:hypothetical protein